MKEETKEEPIIIEEEAQEEEEIDPFILMKNQVERTKEQYL
jgi:hypothetical protein